MKPGAVHGRMPFFLPSWRVLAPWVALMLLGLPWASLSALEFSDIAREGELRFLATNPDPNAYRYESRVALTPASLETGLVELATCHRQLDPIRKVVIAFNPQRLKTLSIGEHAGIGGVQVDGHLVTLTDVRRGASICIALSSKALDAVDGGGWRLQAGPLMRRYLDGYLPMAASLSVSWPVGLLAVSAVEPRAQPGVDIHMRQDGAELKTVFAGRFTGHFELTKPQQ